MITHNELKYFKGDGCGLFERPNKTTKILRTAGSPTEIRTGNLGNDTATPPSLSV